MTKENMKLGGRQGGGTLQGAGRRWMDMIKYIAYICNLQQISKSIVLKKIKVKSYHLR